MSVFFAAPVKPATITHNSLKKEHLRRKAGCRDCVFDSVMNRFVRREQAHINQINAGKGKIHICVVPSGSAPKMCGLIHHD